MVDLGICKRPISHKKQDNRTLVDGLKYEFIYVFLFFIILINLDIKSLTSHKWYQSH